MPGKLVVVAGVVIVRIDATADRIDHRQMMRFLREQRQVLAKSHTWRGRLDRLKHPPILDRRIGLHVPSVDVRRPAAEEEEDGRLRLGGGATRSCR